MVGEPSGFRTDFAGRSLRQSARTIDAYAATAGRRRKENLTNDGRQAGDPVRAAAAMIAAMQSDNPPFRLALGRDAVTRIRPEMETQRRDLDTWADTAISADYPDRE
jgi:hypothetical protein